jgi:hypothetical protein
MVVAARHFDCAHAEEVVNCARNRSLGDALRMSVHWVTGTRIAAFAARHVVRGALRSEHGNMGNRDPSG